jgi:hypothetical protein
MDARTALFVAVMRDVAIIFAVIVYAIDQL